jgi:metal transporter CNNM
MAPIVNALMIVTAPVSWPIAKLLDYILGEHKLLRFNTSQLKALINMHTSKELEDLGHHHYEIADFG